MADLKIILTVVDKDTGKVVQNVRRNLSDLAGAAGTADAKMGGLAGRLGGLTEGLGNLAKPFLAGYLGMQGVEKVVGVATGALESFQQLGMAVHTFQEESGASAETASGLLAVLKRYDVDATSASRSFGIFSKGLRGVFDESEGGAAAAHLFSNALESLDIKTVDSSGNLLAMDTLLFAVADKFKAMPDGVTKTADALALFGRNGKDLISFLNEGGDGIKELMETAKRYGVVLSQDTVESVRKLTLAQRDADAATSGLAVQFGMLTLPIQAAVASGLVPFTIALRHYNELVAQGTPTALAWVQAVAQVSVEERQNAEAADKATAATARMADIMSSADAGARNLAIGLHDHLSPAMRYLPDQLDAQVAAINRATGATAKLEEEIKAASKIGIGLTPDQMEAQKNAEMGAQRAIGYQKEVAAAEAEANKAAAEAKRLLQEGIAEAAKEASKAVRDLSSAFSDLSRTPMLEEKPFTDKTIALGDQLAAIDLQMAGLKTQRGTGAQQRALLRTRKKIEDELNLSTLTERVQIEPLKRTLAETLNPTPAPRSFWDLITNIPRLRGGLAGAEAAQGEENSGLATAIARETLAGGGTQITNQVTVTVAGGQVQVTGNETALGKTIGDAINAALTAFMTAGKTTMPGASPALPGAR